MIDFIELRVAIVLEREYTIWIRGTGFKVSRRRFAAKSYTLKLAKRIRLGEDY